MKKIVILFSFLFIFTALSAQIGVDPRYHTYPEIIEELDSLQNVYPQLLHTEIIGYTNGADPYQEPIPIWAAKISDNPGVDEDEPAVLYIGQCHAEEILGVEVTMYMIKEILDNFYLSPYNVWISNMEIWFVPTMNPEGLQVVMDGWDTSFRKNKRDNNLNQVFDFDPQVGYDADGVDPNRNYSFNWVHGDTLWDPHGEELWDYYRGPGPFSEGGNQALRSLADAQHFIFSINWHSSRSGNHSEKLHYSFNWAGEKRPPDFFMHQSIGNTVAGLIEKEPPQSGCYEPSPSMGRKGLSQDWFYHAYGTTQLMIECGTANLQPGGAQSWLIDDTCERNKVGGYWLLNRALGYQAAASMLTGHITDASTGEPIRAEVIVEDFTAPYLEPRLSDELYGRFWRVLLPGTYDLKIRKKGYTEQTFSDITINNSGWTTIEVAMEPLEVCQVSGTALCNGNPVSGEIIISDIENDTIAFSNGSLNFEAYEGEHNIIALSEGCIPKFDTLNLVAGTHEMNLQFDDAETVFSENWEEGLTGWNSNGTWTTVQGYQETNSLATNSSRFYVYDTTMTITTANPIELSEVADDVVLTLWTKYYTEHVNDVCSIEISTDGSNWTELTQYSGYNHNWEKKFIPLVDFAASNVYLRFKFISDETLNDPGWQVDNIKIISSSGGSVTPPPGDDQLVLKQNFPNPFSQNTTISFALDQETRSDVNLKIFNAKGQLVRTFHLEDVDLSDEEPVVTVPWDGRDGKGNNVASGVYFYMLAAENSEPQLKKCILLR